MNHQQARDLLEDFVDEALSASEMAAVRQHAADCETCREEIEELRELREGTARLAREIAPARDLWPAIAAAIEQRPQGAATRPRARSLVGRLWPAAAAAAAVAAVTLVLVLDRREPAEPPPGSVDASAEMVQALEAECRAGEAELARYTADPDPECEGSGSIITTFLGEIRTIDAAISEVKAAWSSDPNSPQLVRLLASYYRAKAVLQGRATQVASRVDC